MKGSVQAKRNRGKPQIQPKLLNYKRNYDFLLRGSACESHIECFMSSHL